jgi:hypothetical protein
LRHVKDPNNGVEVAIVGKITGHFPNEGSLASLSTWGRLEVQVGTSKS